VNENDCIALGDEKYMHFVITEPVSLKMAAVIRTFGLAHGLGGRTGDGATSNMLAEYLSQFVTLMMIR
jgi:hypothetical protein